MANDPNWNLPEVPSFELSSPDFKQGDQLPVWARGSGDGAEDRSPTLSWSGAPGETRSFAVTVFDPDAPMAGGYWHWAVYNIPATVTALPASMPDRNLVGARFWVRFGRCGPLRICA